MLDIDYFKHINDDYGHQVGDQALRKLAQLLTESVRESDIVARYGGEEFIIIMPDIGLDRAMAAAERVRSKVEENTFDAKIAGAKGRSASRITIKFTISIGVATHPEHAERSDELIMAADLALFAAKHASRNAVRSYTSVAEQEARSGERPVTIHMAMREGSLSAVRALAAAIDARDERMRGHSEKVAIYSLAIGQALGLSDYEINSLRTAALLHDVGRIAVPDAILYKPGMLTEDERNIVKTHSERGAEILAKVPQLDYVAKIVRHHHEHYDGNGYPDGLCGENIPLASRIIAASDAFDAMTSERAYRSASDAQNVILQMKGLKNLQFDPRVIDVIDELITSGKISDLLESIKNELERAA
jgi:diguanylate cyclase (GGDEF)-like protein/putative nucleotidyltransferase with HDIG domain